MAKKLQDPTRRDFLLKIGGIGVVGALMAAGGFWFDKKRISELPLFNLALVPADPKIHNRFFKTASQFQKTVAGYCLYPNNSFPHVTLCQFHAEDRQAAMVAVSKFLDQKLEAKTENIYVNRNQKKNWWVGYEVEKSDQLASLQSEVKRHLEARAIKTLTHAHYRPHFTLAKVWKKPRKIKNDTLSDQVIVCEVRLGLCHESGQFLKVLG